MGLFKQVEGDSVVVVESGVFKQTDLYTRNGFLFAKSGGGFVRLYADGSTSKARCYIDVLAYEGALRVDRLGRLCDSSAPDATLLEAPKATKLLTGASR